VIDAAIFLAEQSGVMAEPWAKAGIRCYCVDIAHSIRKDRVDGPIHYVWGDMRSWTPPRGIRPIFVAAFPPCTHDANTRDFKKKGGMMLRDSLETFEASQLAIEWAGAFGCPGMIEHPGTMLVSIPHIDQPQYRFHPYEYSAYCADDWYTKQTNVWANEHFHMPEPCYDVERYQRGLEQHKRYLKDKTQPQPDWPDNRIHFASPGEDRADIRSESPKGFSFAVYLANRRQIEPVVRGRPETKPVYSVELQSQ
jgi:hypothetical protein